MLGPERVKFDDLILEGKGECRKAKGLRTVDRREHCADVVVIACRFRLPSWV